MRLRRVFNSPFFNVSVRILIVEDEKKVASFIKKGLEEEYYSVDTAFDAKKAYALL